VRETGERRRYAFTRWESRDVAARHLDRQFRDAERVPVKAAPVASRLRRFIMRTLVIVVVVLCSAHGALAQAPRTCTPDSMTQLSILARKPGAILSSQSDPIATFTSASTGSSARIDTRILTDAESKARAAGVAVFIATAHTGATARLSSTRANSRGC
jgi:hypothetical protein